MSLHVCFISSGVYGYFNPDRATPGGGRERQQYLLTKELAKRGFDVSIITDDYGQPEPERFGDITFWKGSTSEIGVKQFPRRVGTLVRKLHQVDADVFYIRGSPTLTIATALYCNAMGRSFVHCVSGDILVDPEMISERFSSVGQAFHRVYIRAAASADRVVSLTNHQRRLLATEYGITAQVVPVCYDYPNESELVPHRDRSYVLWVGRISQIKRPLQFVDVADAMPEREFVMVGGESETEPELYAEVRSRSEEIDNFRVEGYVLPSEIDEYYRNASAVIHTTETQGIGNITLEAWRYATPVVSLYSTLDGFLPETEIGLYAGGSLAQLSDQIRSVTSDPTLAETLGTNGRQHLIENYSLEHITDVYEDLFTAIA
ncbi:glycosyltransferase family 4 protein [Salinadaptatus halalkaliphilus]|nr:glycosyltransferase family 4 protein [Salinadaptatus halalkaliphilus]